MDTLTDELIAEIVASDVVWGTLGVGSREVEDIWRAVKGLAVEVQQSRARRCDACTEWSRAGWDEVPETGTCERLASISTDAEFFCAHFTPKAPNA